MVKEVIKRNGRKEKFRIAKIRNAISRANDEVPVLEQASDEEIDSIIREIKHIKLDCVHIEVIQNMIENALMQFKHFELAKTYIKYRYIHTLGRELNATENSIIGIIRGTNKEVIDENSNKNGYTASTQRDLMAGEVSKDIAKKVLIPQDIQRGMDKCWFHWHDLDYTAQKMINCCLIDIKDMLDNGTVINNLLIESPHSFRVACNIMTQIIANIASNQYGGQSVAIKHLGRYVAVSRERTLLKYTKMWDKAGIKYTEEQLLKVVEETLKQEIAEGVQTIQYQINTLLTVNGQAPFLTLFMHIEDGFEYEEEVAMIVEEILNQRIQGVKNEKGVYVTPAFPKLIYVLDENNIHKNSKYRYITELAAKCSIKRSYPDYISAKIMKKDFDGEVFSCMGCVDGKEVISYKLDNKIYCESFVRAWDRLSKRYKVESQGKENYSYMDTDGILIWDNKKESYVPCYRFIRNLQNKWYTVKLSNGRLIKVTNDHPFETNRGVVLAEDLKKDDVILVDKYSNFCDDNNDCYTDRVAWLLGLILCDSSIVNTLNISLGLDELDIQNRAQDILDNDFPDISSYLVEQRRGDKGNYNDIRVKSAQVTSSGLRDLLNSFEGIKKIERHIPNELWNCSREVRLAFLGGILDADGGINTNSGTSTVVGLGSTNYELAMQELLLAQSVGYPARMYINHYSSKDPSKIRYRVEFDADDELSNYIFCKKKADNIIEPNRINNSNYFSDYSNVVEITYSEGEDFSYDVTTASEHFTVSGIYSHNCRSFLSPWKITAEYAKMNNLPDSEIGKYKWEGRFNQGVISLNLPQIGIEADGDWDKFWVLLEERLVLVYKALLLRHKLLEDTLSDVSPLHWQFGAIARLKSGESINKLLHDGYSTISLGYIGLYETIYAMTGKSHTSEEGFEYALKIMKKLRTTCDTWKEQTGLGFGLYGTPSESLCYKFCKHDLETYGSIPNVTDKGYYTNSYHVDVREKINAFDKFKFESQFQSISSGGAISYVEIPNLDKNHSAVIKLIEFIYDNIRYAEFNSKSDYCYECGFDGEIKLNNDNHWECPICHNTNMKRMTVTRRTCGYLGQNDWNWGKRKEIANRVLHL